MLETYNIYENPKYGDIIKAIDASSNQIKIINKKINKKPIKKIYDN